MDDKQWTYCFSTWPSETWGFDQSVFQLFEMLKGQVEMVFIERDFEMFRSKLNHAGLTLREVFRVPYVEPEIVT